MNYEKIMTEIKSVREFKKQAVDSNLLSLIIKEIILQVSVSS